VSIVEVMAVTTCLTSVHLIKLDFRALPSSEKCFLCNWWIWENIQKWLFYYFL